MPFITPLRAEAIQGRHWKLLAPLIYRGRHQELVVPAGFVTDLGSVPWWATWLVPRDDEGRPAYVLHDYHYRTGQVSRRDADGILRRTLRERGYGRVRRWTAWAGVRLGGWVAWRRWRRIEMVEVRI